MDMDRMAQGFAFMSTLMENFGEAQDLNNEDAQKYLEENILNTPLSSDTFYALMDLRKMAFTFSHGTESFFGIKELTFPYFFSQINEAYREMFLTWGEAAYSAAYDPENRKLLQPLKQEYRTMLPVKNRAGEYYWLTQIAIPLQFDADRNLLTHLNVYRVGIAYEAWKNWAIKGEILENNLPRKDFAFTMEEYVREYVSSTFGKRKYQMLKLYASGTSTDDIAASFTISKKTLYTHNKDILAKANKIFHRNFSTVKEAANSLQENGYLE
ncbi:MAG: LuxR C-terminal-related transcriptional regulator [Bacteroidota bacterium]